MDLYSRFFVLIALHAVVDYSLQTDWIARGKSRHTNPSCALGMPWYYILLAHSLQHGLAVLLVTASLLFGLVETFAHFLIDLAKNERLIGPHQDQFLHVLLKVAFVFGPAYFGPPLF